MLNSRCSLLRFTFLGSAWRTSGLAVVIALCLEACGGGGGSTSQPTTPEPPTAPPPPANVTYTIAVSSGPTSAVASVGENAESNVTWSFTASSATAGSTSYTVSSSTSGVQITNGSGSVVPGTSITTQLSYSCASAGVVEAQITFTVDSATETVTWSIDCSEEQITFSPLADVRIEQDEAALVTFTWQFGTTGDSSRSFNFEVASESGQLQISNATGSAQPGTDIENRLRYACQDVGVHAVTFQISVGSATQRVAWSVACTVKDISAVTAKFHQGPLLEQVEFTWVDEQWQSEVVPLYYGSERALRLGTSRQLFVTVSFESEVQSEMDIALLSTATSTEATIEQISSSNLTPNQSGTRTNYVRRVTFAVVADDLASLGVLTIRLDPDDAIPQLNEAKNDIVFGMDSLELVELPQFRLTLLPIKASTGEPDLSDISVYEDTLYDLLPFGVFTVSVGETVDITSEGEFDGLVALNAVFDRWVETASRNEFYHGIFTPPNPVTVCGLAHVGGNAGATGEVSDFCSKNTIAHEVGHNLSLNHAPACGAENADPDERFPYTDGSIGTEGGWLMRKRQAVGGEAFLSSKIYDTMSYCLETFTSQYSYGKASDYFVSRYGNGISASEPPQTRVAGFEQVEGRSLALSGNFSNDDGWVLRKQSYVTKKPLSRLRRATEFELTACSHDLRYRTPSRKG